MGRIVVGVDGSPCSSEALRWALAEAVLRRCPLEVLASFHLSSSWLGMGEAMGAGVSTTLTESELATFTRDSLTAVIDEVAGPDPGVEIVLHTVPGRPADVLVEASKGAALLVIGSRGHGELASALLGSTGLHCVHHAHCPVVVVRGAADPDADGPTETA
ncbi:MAG TPA: universal stress protein [Acidimicrobiales bacterium]|nr:universal stress protein [Acidimicrobiales bacterium]